MPSKEEDIKTKEEEETKEVTKEEGTKEVTKEEEEVTKEDGPEKKKPKVEEKSWLDHQISLIDADNKWKEILTAQALKSRKLFTFVEGLPTSRVLPAQADIFNAFKLCPFDKVKVVILGQDPYHGPKQAHGLSFSVQSGIAPPPSLKNIFKEAKSDLGEFTSGKGGDLTRWAEQGVLLLNTLLTVEPSTPNAHKGKGWETFTDACIIKLTSERSNLVFFFWGKPAQEKAKLVKNASKHLIINSSHPSPLGANAKHLPFFGSKCFSKCNEYLKANALEEIDWNL
ncbi:uracil-DNA glycosylase [Batrachochytrium salamandrivorans]|nr:uracil-DNA glycosylase [Batrachochytrium salamandrivorans]